jgi:hypothetical protein
MASGDEHSKTSRDRSELALAVLAGIAMLAFAWAGFQSSLWVRERFLLSDEAAAVSQDALELGAEADRAEEQDSLLYIEWRLALRAGNQDVADGVFDLFRPEFQEYIRRADVDDRGIPSTDPRDDPSYDVVGKRADSTQLEREAASLAAQSRLASRTGARFGVLNLMFAAVLAVAGIASRLDLPRTRMGLTMISGVLLLVGVVVMVSLPTIIDWP